MNPFKEILLIVLALLYVISPFDVIPDSIPLWGWLDDGILFGLLIYYLWWGKLPDVRSWWRGSSETDHQEPGRSARTNRLTKGRSNTRSKPEDKIDS